MVCVCGNEWTWQTTEDESGQALDEGALDQAIQQLGSQDSGLRWDALRVLTQMSEQDLEQHVGAIAVLLSDESSEVRWSVADLLQMFEPDALLPYIESILALLQDENGGVRWAAADLGMRVLGAENVTEAHVEVVVAQLRHPDAGVRSATLEALNWNNGGATRYGAIVAELTQDSDPSVRRGALERLVHLGDDDEDSVAEYSALLLARVEHDSDPDVRVTALRALANLPLAELVELGDFFGTVLGDAVAALREKVLWCILVPKSG